MRNGSWAVAGLFVVLLSACSGDVSQIGTGGTGGAGLQDPNCPAEVPQSGEACGDPLTCTYAACDGQAQVTATCANGVWSAPVTAACAPLSTSSACNPFGTWHVESDLDSLYGMVDGYPDDFDLVIGKTATGIPIVTGPHHAKLGADGCTFSAQWTISSWTNPEDPSWSADEGQELELVFSGDDGTGTLRRYCDGECAPNLDESSPATAKKTAP